MKIIVGLGNPGQEYSETRHNVGFMAVDELARRWGVQGWKSRFDALTAEHRGHEPIMLVKPQTYMNLSGAAAGAVLRWYKLPVSEMIVIYDDLDLPAGKVRLRSKGGTGGHRGVESLLAHLGKDEFARVRIGIGRPPGQTETVNYVLGRFAAEEKPLIAAAVARAADAVEAVLKHGIEKAMNEFNR